MGRASPGQTYHVIARNGSLRRSSYVRLVLFSIFASSFVLITSLVVQWLIYDDWLHQTGSLRIVGTCIAAALTFVFVFRWLQAEAQRRSEMLQRFETIARMNDRIRNALQVIECTTYASAPQATEHVKTAVEALKAGAFEYLAKPLDIEELKILRFPNEIENGIDRICVPRK